MAVPRRIRGSSAIDAPSSTVTPASGPAQVLAYDLNGNQTTGLDGKVMSYDGENRPVSVSFAGRTTAYVYGADGARLTDAGGAVVERTTYRPYRPRRCGLRSR